MALEAHRKLSRQAEDESLGRTEAFLGVALRAVRKLSQVPLD
jgi:hypothetical protein